MGGTPGWNLSSSARRYGWPPSGLVFAVISARSYPPLSAGPERERERGKREGGEGERGGGGERENMKNDLSSNSFSSQKLLELCFLIPVWEFEGVSQAFCLICHFKV